MRVALVLRSGGDFDASHIARLCRQVTDHLPGAQIFCLSDVEVPCPRIELRYDWPGWWSKMELFRPDIGGDLLFMDLDTSIVGTLEDIAAVDRLTVLSDFYWPTTGRIQSSLMFIPERDRQEIWDAWIADPSRHMRECVTRERWGDQGFLGQFWQGRAQRWQDALPGQVVSYKCHVREKTRSDKEFGDGTLPENARVVIFHGKPRPWEIGW